MFSRDSNQTSSVSDTDFSLTKLGHQNHRQLDGRSETKLGSFPFVPPIMTCFRVGASYLPPPPATENLSIHGTPLCKNIARTFGGANNKHPLSLGAQTEKIPKLNGIVNHKPFQNHKI